MTAWSLFECNATSLAHLWSVAAKAFSDLSIDVQSGSNLGSGWATQGHSQSCHTSWSGSRADFTCGPMWARTSFSSTFMTCDVSATNLKSLSPDGAAFLDTSTRQEVFPSTGTCFKLRLKQPTKVSRRGVCCGGGCVDVWGGVRAGLLLRGTVGSPLLNLLKNKFCLLALSEQPHCWWSLMSFERPIQFIGCLGSPTAGGSWCSVLWSASRSSTCPWCCSAGV